MSRQITNASETVCLIDFQLSPSVVYAELAVLGNCMASETVQHEGKYYRIEIPLEAQGRAMCLLERASFNVTDVI